MHVRTYSGGLLFCMLMKNVSLKNFAWTSYRGIAILSIIGLAVLGFLGSASSAFAQDTQRPAASGYNTLMTENPEQAPPGWTCSQTGHDPANWLCTSPDGNSWLQRQHTFIPDEAGIGSGLDAMCYGTGPTGQCEVYQSYRPNGIFGTISEDPVVNETGEVTGVNETRTDIDVLGFLRDLTLGTIAAIILFVTEITAAFLGGILALISFLFDMVVVEFVIGMGKYINSTSAQAVRTAWTMIRDLANIGIIGGLVAIAIGTIIGSEKNGIQKNLARLLIAALLVNFSYFFAGAIIDASNFLSRTIYYEYLRETGGDCPAEGCGPATQFLRSTNIDAWMNATRLNLNELSQGGVVNDATAQSNVGGEISGDVNQTLTNTEGIVYNVMRIIFVIVTSFVFLSAISLLVARFVALIFLVITSPIGIAGSAVPLLSKYSKEWWDALWSQTMFAPVYLLLVGISLKILDAFKGSLLTGPSDNGAVSIIGVIAMFTIAIGFMWAALSTAKSMSAEAKRFSELYKATEKGLGWMPKAYTGLLKTGAGIALRDTVGAQAFKWNEAYRKFAAKNDLAGNKNALVRAGDRALQDLLHKGATREYAKGVKGYEKTREERRGREALLGEVKREEEQDKQYDAADKEAQKKRDVFDKEAKDGERKMVDDGKGGKRLETEEEFWARQALRDQKIKVKDADGSERWEKDSETLARLGLKDAKELLTTEKGKVRAMNAKELADKFGDRARLKIKNEDGTERKETDAEMQERLAKGLGRKRRISKKGNAVEEGEYNYQERLDKMKDLHGDVSFRDARAKAGAIFATFTNDFVKRRYEENPESVVKYARWAPYDKFKQIADDKSIRRDLRDKMAEERWGRYAAQVAGIQKDVDDGKIVEFGEEYQRRMIIPYQYMQNNMKTGTEQEDFMRSTGVIRGEDGKPVMGKDGQPMKFEDLRKTRAMQQAFSSTKFVDIKDSKIFDPTEQRNMNSDKRKGLTNMRDEWAAIQIAKGYGENKFRVPNVEGTTEYDARARGIKAVQEQMSALQKVVDNSPLESERVAANRHLKTLKAIAAGQEAIDAELIQAGVATNADGSINEDARDKFLVERKKALKQAVQSQNFQDPNDENDRSAYLDSQIASAKAAGKPAFENLDRILDREILIEGGYDDKNPNAAGIPEWYKGKNSVKELGVLGKREAVTPPLIYGLDVANFEAIYNSGFDKVEKDLFWQNMLVYGNPAVVRNIMNTPDLRKLVSVPDPSTEEFKEINKERIRNFGEGSPGADLNDIIPEGMFDDPNDES